MIRWDEVLTIAGLVGGTYLTRYLGFWLAEHLPLGPRVSAALDAAAGGTMIALVAPTALARGPAEAVATAAVLLLAWLGRPLMAILAGMAVVAALRALLA